MKIVVTDYLFTLRQGLVDNDLAGQLLILHNTH